MPKEMEINARHPVQLDSGDLNAILAYVARIRSLKVALDERDKIASLQPYRDEIKALVNAKRALRRVPTPPAEHGRRPLPHRPRWKSGRFPSSTAIT